jgi:HlyD family secretion protein
LQLSQAELRAAEAALAELAAGARPEELAAAEATVQAAQARVDELTAGSRPDEVRAAEAAAAGAAADAQLAQLELERRRQLLASQAIPPQEFDRAKTDAERAAAALTRTQAQLALVREGPRAETIALAKAQLREAQQRCELVRKGARTETLDQAKARVEQARAAAGLAEIRLGYATIHSPMDGLVLSDHSEPGEYVAPGTPVVTVGDLAHVWLRAYVSETELGRVRVGQPVRVTTDTYPGKVYAGTLSFLSSEAEFTPKSVQTAKERVKLVYRVKIRIDNPAFELKPGMPADAVIGLR